MADAYVFVDGNNLMGARPDGWWRDRRAAQRRIAAQLEQVARRAGGQWTVVFDGAPPRGDRAARFSPAGDAPMAENAAPFSPAGGAPLAESAAPFSPADGGDARRAEGAGALRIEFARRRGPDAADDRIVDLLRALPETAGAAVYTSDRRLRDRAKALGARVEGVSGLLRRMEHHADAHSQQEVERSNPSPHEPERTNPSPHEWGGREGASWAAFDAADPELAALGRALLLENQLVLVGSLRKDGWPRISPVEPLFHAGELYLGMMWRSRKALDLLRDSRCTVMNTVHDRMLKDGEFKLTGRAIEIADPSERTAYEAAVREQMGFDLSGEEYHLFRLAIATASFAKIENDDWVRKFWRAPDLSPSTRD